MAPAERPTLLLPAVGLLAFAGFVALALADRDLYARLIDLWSFQPGARPFLDLEAPLAWIRAWRAGADVYLAAPPGAHGWRMNYSPLRLPLPADESAVPAYGIAIDVLFLGSLAVLPRPRAAADRWPLLLALFSPFVIFGLERGNLDLLIFVAAALAVLCLGRGLALRACGYATVVCAGLLKFYPWVLLLMLLRERLAVFLLASAAVSAVLVAFVLGYHGELAHAVANLPTTIPFTDAFGASQLATGIVLLAHPLHAPPKGWDAADGAIWIGGKVAAYGIGLVAGVRLGGSAALRRALARLSPRETSCLWAGAALMCGCFFVGTSVGYRAVDVLLALPGLLALARVADEVPLARRARTSVLATLVVLWSLPMQRVIADLFGEFWIVGIGLTTEWPLGLALGGAFWLVRELLWWWLMTLLLAVLVRLVRDSRVWAEVLA